MSKSTRISATETARPHVISACAGGQIVKLTVATKASGAAALTERVPDPRRPGAVWKSSTNELCYAENYCETFVNLYAVELPQLRGRRRVDGVEPPRHRADPLTEIASRRWRGASDI